MDKRKNEKTGLRGLLMLDRVYFDYPALFLIIFLVFFGLMMVYSASSFVAYRDFGSGTFFLRKQAAYALIGFVFLIMLSFYKYQGYKKFTELFLIVQGLLLILVFIIGSTKNGSSRWLKLGPISFQPSELAKIVVILYMARICSAKPKEFQTLKGTIKSLFPVLILVGLIAVENLSTAIICAAIIGVVWVVAVPNFWRYLVPLVVIAGIAGTILVFAQPYRLKRFEVWLHPEKVDEGYQTLQGLYAIGSGGLFGRGLGQSIQKMGFIPEAQNDMIFSIICEEIGIVGAAGVIIVFLMLIWRLRFIAEGAPDKYGALIVVGAIAHIASQAIVNMCVVTNLIPNTGVTLPFISYGGSSIIFTLAEMGIVLSVSRQIVPISELEKEAAE